MNIEILKKLGLSDKEAIIYLELLRLGPSSVRQLAEKTDVNRGTVYDCLKRLQILGIVEFYEKEAKQFFVATDPVRLRDLAKRQIEDTTQASDKLNDLIPELKSLYDSGGERPVSRYFSKDEIHKILEDVLTTCAESEEKKYRIYSAEGVRKYLYEQFPTFSDVRVAKGIAVCVVAIGDGGELRGLDERRWLKSAPSTPTYIIIYPKKTAYISLNAKNEPVGVVIENEGVAETQKTIFDSLWNSLS
ncbi:MAG TPA: helix-turn-helix domain-containing protein [Candidatus Magasanikbacteria bacterium]|nr:helix-turn-helix domain-containing protein [Candidatus Magasanikbacteria bacterium]